MLRNISDLILKNKKFSNLSFQISLLTLSLKIDFYLSYTADIQKLIIK